MTPTSGERRRDELDATPLLHQHRRRAGELHPRTLRIYEEEGLVQPQRRNNLRLYSEADIQRVRIIRFLTRTQRVNLAGVRVILQLEALGKIRVYDLFDEDDVERFADKTPKPMSPTSQSSSKEQPDVATENEDQTQDIPEIDATDDEENGAPLDRVQVVPLVALRDTVIFPEMIVPLTVGRDRSVKALDRAVRTSQPVALVTQRSSEQEDIAERRRALRDRHAGEDRPGRPAPGRHDPRHRPGPARASACSTSSRPTRTSRLAIELVEDQPDRASRSRR